MVSVLLISGLLVISFLWTRLAPAQATNLLLAAGRWAIGMRRHEVRVAGFNIVYLEGGQGEPLLLLHGIGADKDNFNLVARALRKRYRVIVPDIPGFGESDKPADAGYGVQQQVARIAAFATAVGAARFHVGGNSMGGMIAGALAVAEPQRVLSLWLLAPAGVKSAKPSELIQKIEAGEPLPIFARNADEMRALLAFACHRAPWLPGFVIEAAARLQRDNYALNQTIVAELFAGPGLDELMGDGPATPTLIVWGDHDRALHYSGATILHALLPNSSVQLMTDIGHVPMIEAPRRVVRDYLEFQRSAHSERA